MAEEALNEEQEETRPTFDKDAIETLVKKSVKDSFNEVLQQQAPRSQEPTKQVDNPFADWVNPLVDHKVNAATLASQDAQDKVDFYTSDAWLTDIDDFLVNDDPAKRATEKKALRDKIETTFSNMLKMGKGICRADIKDYVIGQKLKEDKAAYQESIGRRLNKKKEADLDKAAKGVNISAGNISNFTAADIHKMTFEKRVETFGEVLF